MTKVNTAEVILPYATRLTHYMQSKRWQQCTSRLLQPHQLGIIEIEYSWGRTPLENLVGKFYGWIIRRAVSKDRNDNEVKDLSVSIGVAGDGRFADVSSVALIGILSWLLKMCLKISLDVIKDDFIRRIDA